MRAKAGKRMALKKKQKPVVTMENMSVSWSGFDSIDSSSVSVYDGRLQKSIPEMLYCNKLSWIMAIMKVKNMDATNHDSNSLSAQQNETSHIFLFPSFLTSFFFLNIFSILPPSYAYASVYAYSRFMYKSYALRPIFKNAMKIRVANKPIMTMKRPPILSPGLNVS